jgi:hypothetical protein
MWQLQDRSTQPARCVRTKERRPDNARINAASRTRTAVCHSRWRRRRDTGGRQGGGRRLACRRPLTHSPAQTALVHTYLALHESGLIAAAIHFPCGDEHVLGQVRHCALAQVPLHQAEPRVGAVLRAEGTKSANDNDQQHGSGRVAVPTTTRRHNEQQKALQKRPVDRKSVATARMSVARFTHARTRAAAAHARERVVARSGKRASEHVSLCKCTVLYCAVHARTCKSALSRP